MSAGSATTASAQTCTVAACPAATCSVNDLTGTDGAGCCTALGGCKTIQGGVADAVAGDVIDVAAGTYTTAGVLTINKTLTLCGANDGVDARGIRLPESIISASGGTFITASNVVINGFTIQDSTSGAFTGYGVTMGPTTAGTTGTQILANIIQNNIIGIGLANTGTTQVVICENLIQNNNNPGPSSGTGIYSDEFVCGSNAGHSGGPLPCTNFLIEENTFTGNDDSGIFISDTEELGPLTALDVSTNLFDNNARAIGLINTDDSSIHDNTITNSTGAATATIRIFDDVDNLNILRNDLNTGAGYGIRLTDSGFIPGGPHPSHNIHINLNNIVAFGLDGLNVGTAAVDATVDAECNWWNSASGPNSGGASETSVGDADFTPWSIAPNPGGACTGGLPTPTPTETPVLTATPTETPILTATPTQTPVLTATPTSTVVNATATPTSTVVNATATPTSTVVNATATPTSTVVNATATPTATITIPIPTFTLPIPTSTSTVVNPTATRTATPTPTTTSTPAPAVCGNMIVEPGETCDPPGSVPPANVNPNGNHCQANCTFCGDGITQPPESCDDGNSNQCDPTHPQKPFPGDSCSNQCTGLICKDPSSIKISSGLDVFKAHGVLVPMTDDLIDFNANPVTVSLTSGQSTIFTVSVPAGTILPRGKSFKYSNRDARETGGIAKLVAVRTHDGTYKVTVTSYGEVVGAGTDMVTHISVGDVEWTVHATWAERGSGWKFISAIP